MTPNLSQNPNRYHKNIFYNKQTIIAHTIGNDEYNQSTMAQRKRIHSTINNNNNLNKTDNQLFSFSFHTNDNSVFCKLKQPKITMTDANSLFIFYVIYLNFIVIFANETNNTSIEHNQHYNHIRFKLMKISRSYYFRTQLRTQNENINYNQHYNYIHRIKFDAVRQNSNYKPRPNGSHKTYGIFNYFNHFQHLPMYPHSILCQPERYSGKSNVFHNLDYNELYSDSTALRNNRLISIIDKKLIIKNNITDACKCFIDIKIEDDNIIEKINPLNPPGFTHYIMKNHPFDNAKKMRETAKGIILGLAETIHYINRNHMHDKLWSAREAKLLDDEKEIINIILDHIQCFNHENDHKTIGFHYHSCHKKKFFYLIVQVLKRYRFVHTTKRTEWLLKLPGNKSTLTWAIKRCPIPQVDDDEEKKEDEDEALNIHSCNQCSTHHKESRFRPYGNLSHNEIAELNKYKSKERSIARKTNFPKITSKSPFEYIEIQGVNVNIYNGTLDGQLSIWRRHLYIKQQNLIIPKNKHLIKKGLLLIKCIKSESNTIRNELFERWKNEGFLPHNVKINCISKRTFNRRRHNGVLLGSKKSTITGAKTKKEAAEIAKLLLVIDRKANYFYYQQNNQWLIEATCSTTRQNENLRKKFIKSKNNRSHGLSNYKIYENPTAITK